MEVHFLLVAQHDEVWVYVQCGEATCPWEGQASLVPRPSLRIESYMYYGWWCKPLKGRAFAHSIDNVIEERLSCRLCCFYSAPLISNQCSVHVQSRALTLVWLHNHALSGRGKLQALPHHQELASYPSSHFTSCQCANIGMKGTLGWRLHSHIQAFSLSWKAENVPPRRQD